MENAKLLMENHRIYPYFVPFESPIVHMSKGIQDQPNMAASTVKTTWLITACLPKPWFETRCVASIFKHIYSYANILKSMCFSARCLHHFLSNLDVQQEIWPKKSAQVIASKVSKSKCRKPCPSQLRHARDLSMGFLMGISPKNHVVFTIWLLNIAMERSTHF